MWFRGLSRSSSQIVAIPALKRHSNVSVSKFKQTTKGTDSKCQHGVRSSPGAPLNKAIVSTTVDYS